MDYRDWIKIRHLKPMCIGTGLVALDVVIRENQKSPPKLWAGGSCGNVLIILSYLGWKSYPIARLGNDAAARELLKDMAKWKVRNTLVFCNDSESTPIIVEKLGITYNGISCHRFEWVCPNCGSRLPKYRPVLAKDIEQIVKKMPTSQVFYFDRVIRSAVELAKMNRNRGSLIVFEPSGIKDEKLFLECLQVADIVKYPRKKLGHAQALIREVGVPLEVETLGEEGLMYRLSRNGRKNRKYKIMRAYPVEKLRDTAGCGDWCSAGIIHLLGNAGRKGFENAKAKDIEAALSFGQALAALNCHYEGARGSMYNMTRRKFESVICNIWNGTSYSESMEEKENGQIAQVFGCICPNCASKGVGK